jgi:hypothetical protein
VSSNFQKTLKAAIDAKFDGLRAFIREADPKANEDSAVSYLSKVIKGKKPPPIDRIDAWARALDLKGPELERFLDLACIAHLPAEAQPRFEKILGRLEAAEAALLQMSKSKK